MFFWSLSRLSQFVLLFISTFNENKSCAQKTMTFFLTNFCTTLVNEDTYDIKSIEAYLITTQINVSNASATKIIELTSEVGPPNNNCAAFVGRFNDYVLAFSWTFQCRPLFRRKIGKFGVTTEFKFVDIVATFLMKKSKDAYQPSGGMHLDFRT